MTAQELRARLRNEVADRFAGQQAEFAQRLGVSRSYIGHVLNNRTALPVEFLVRILDELGLKLVIVPKDKE